MPEVLTQPALYNRHRGRTPADAVYIGRGGPWGNPFVIGEHGDRTAVIARYERWLATQPELMERARRELAGRDLECFCAPAPCHGDVLLRVANESAQPAPVQVATGYALLRGTILRPHFEVHVHPKLTHPANRKLRMGDWAKEVMHGQWRAASSAWLLHGLNSPDPLEVLAEAGLEFRDDDREGELVGVDVADLIAPVAKLADDGRTVLVLPRLSGHEHTLRLIGVGAVWDGERKLFRMYVGDVLREDTRGGILEPRPEVYWPDDAIDVAYALHAHQPVPTEIEAAAERVAGLLDLDSDAAHADAAAIVDYLGISHPNGGTRALFPYQQAGSLALAAGRSCLFDEPGVGKTAQALAAARAIGANRVLIVCPPLLSTNWRREAVMAGFDADHVARVKAGRKEPAYPDTGVLIIPDSTLGAKPDLVRRAKDWLEGVDDSLLIVDEAHRLKTITSRRSNAVLDVGMSSALTPFVLTGTPIINAPHELVPLLELTRMIAPVFGGRSQFLEDFCRQDQFGSWHARKSALPRLRQLLRSRVAIRRRKVDVLPQLPPKRRRALILEVPLSDYRAAHKEAIGRVLAWITTFEKDNGRPPDESEFEEYAHSSTFELISMLRRAAGLAKVPVMRELVASWLEENPRQPLTELGGQVGWPRPLIVWAHHIDVIEAILDVLPNEAAVIYGPTRDDDRDAIVDDFQAHQIPVLVGGITKAGVGLTLTASSDTIFAETDWTPGSVKQCEDRQHRIGQVNPTDYTTLVATGTLDEPIQRILWDKTDILEKALGDFDDSVAVMGKDDAAGLAEIARLLVDEAIAEWKRRRPKSSRR